MVQKFFSERVAIDAEHLAGSNLIAIGFSHHHFEQRPLHCLDHHVVDARWHLAVEVAGKFLREKLGRDDQARLVRDSVASLGTKPSVN